ncbi:hypothetical protein Tco_1079002 [Tanacetum coccineum]|uniref:Uncharacterized protein n=1 Tax=Tanacetum coccineum TaxID=301880 RepID=A0ABQ5HS50_9ASTR
MRVASSRFLSKEQCDTKEKNPLVPITKAIYESYPKQIHMRMIINKRRDYEEKKGGNFKIGRRRGKGEGERKEKRKRRGKLKTKGEKIRGGMGRWTKGKMSKVSVRGLGDSMVIVVVLVLGGGYGPWLVVESRCLWVGLCGSAISLGVVGVVVVKYCLEGG